MTTLDEPIDDDEAARAAALLPVLRAGGVRRRRRRTAVKAGVATVAVVATGVAVPLAVLGGGGHGQRVTVEGPTATTATTATTAVRTPGTASVPVPGGGLGRFFDPDAYVASTGLYVSAQVDGAHGLQPDRLSRLDPVTGAVEASVDLGGSEDSMLLAAGTLWVTTVSTTPVHGNGIIPTDLVALDPSTLRVKQRVALPAGAYTGRTLTWAGGWLWVADGSSLVRVSTATGAVTSTVPVPGAVNLTVTSDQAGTTLIVAEGFSGGGARLQRRDPSDGRMIIQTAEQGWVGAPELSTVVDGGVWVAFSGGMQGSVERRDAETLATTPTQLGFSVASQINALVAGGRLFVTQVGGGPSRNYCGSAVTGRAEASLAAGFSAGTTTLLAADASNLYVAVEVPGSGAETVERLPISPACTG